MAQKTHTPDCRNCLFLGSLTEAGLPKATIDGICQRMWLNEVRRRQILYLEGNRSSSLYAIRSGQVKLVKVDASGREHVTALLGSGDLFGIEAAFDQPYATGAEALTDCELCLVSASDLRGLISDTPHFALDLARSPPAFPGRPAVRARMRQGARRRPPLHAS